MPSITISDTSCLILFHKIGKLNLLKELFGTITITDTVLKEYNEAIPDWISVINPKTNVHDELAGYLDLGEASSIALAYEHEGSLIIIDEIKGRKAARELAMKVTGSLGILIAAKRNGYLEVVKPVIDDMISAIQTFEYHRN